MARRNKNYWYGPTGKAWTIYRGKIVPYKKMTRRKKIFSLEIFGLNLGDYRSMDRALRKGKQYIAISPHRFGLNSKKAIKFAQKLWMKRHRYKGLELTKWR